MSCRLTVFGVYILINVLYAYLLEILVTANVFLFMGVLQLVRLDVLPQGLDDTGAGLRVDAQQASKTRVQLKLGRLGEVTQNTPDKDTHQNDTAV